MAGKFRLRVPMLPKGGELRRALGATTWLLGHRVLALVIGLASSVLVARYLGPADFGRLSFAIAFVGLLGAVQHLGLVGLVTQELVREPDRTNEILGSVFALKLASGFALFLIAVPIGFLLADSPQGGLVISLVALGMLLEAGTVFTLFFEARVRGAPVAISLSVALIANFALRVAAIVLGAPLWIFGAIYAAQVALTSLCLWSAYRRGGHSVRAWRASYRCMKQLLSRSWPIAVSTASAMIYLKIDQLMLGRMSGMGEVGTYAVAARISEMSYLLPAILTGAIFPRLIRIQAEQRARYDLRIRQSFEAMFWAGTAIAIIVTLTAHPVIEGLFGEDFARAAPIAAVHIWACPAMFMGILAQRWHLADDLQNLLIPRQIAGAVANVCLNFLLIPPLGGLGAAIATVASYTFAQYVLMFAHPQTRRLALWMTSAPMMPALWRSVRAREMLGTSHKAQTS